MREVKIYILACGIPNRAASKEAKIVGGKKADVGEYPWQASREKYQKLINFKKLQGCVTFLQCSAYESGMWWQSGGGQICRHCCPLYS